MSAHPYALLLSMLVGLCGCGLAQRVGHVQRPSEPQGVDVQAPRAAAASPAAAVGGSVGRVAAPAGGRAASAISPRAVRRARRHLGRARALYRAGAYEAAAALLLETLHGHPFLAEAHLLLGKIQLLQGAVRDDAALRRSAQSRFEMAHQLDPNLQEATLLLELPQPPAP